MGVPLLMQRARLPVISADGLEPEIARADDLAGANRFDRVLARHSTAQVRRSLVTTLQVNLGKRCNMACLHCHVEAGPERTEVMERPVVERIVELVQNNPSVELLDVTGGAPELNPDFRWLVTAVRALDRRVIDRCNLTVLLEPGNEELAEFLAANQVEIVASLPCYSPANLEKQRGRGAFDKSIVALQKLGSLGYGRPGSQLRLSLVYNPIGPTLPPAQAGLEATYKAQLREHFGIEFHELLTITNMPIKRFEHALQREGLLEGYYELLERSFNPATTDAVMCRSMLSVGYDGSLYDCDFNQMLELPLGARPRTVWEVDDLADVRGARITTGAHCLGCTAGAGSSCGGALS